jgi:hypothetical protein
MTGTNFSPDRIEETLARMRAFLAGDERGPLLSLYHEPTYRQEADEETMLAEAAAVIRKDGASPEPDILPVFAPDFGTVSTAAVYGGRRIRPRDGGNVHIEPAADSVAALAALTPAPFEETDYGRAVALYRRLCERLETAAVYLRTPDFQGPMNTLALLVDQTELLCALYEEPAAVHAALDRVTDMLIAYTRRFRDEVGAEKVVGNIWPYVCLPDGKGVALTQDMLPLLSPDLYATFELPRLARIAAAFGGVYIHCCGRYGGHLPALAAAEMEILGLEVHHPETTAAEICEHFGDRVAITPYVAPSGATEFPDLPAFVRSLGAATCRAGRYWFCACHEWGDTAALKRAVTETFPAVERA